MRISRSEPGFALSAAIHFGLLAFLLVNFSRDAKFDDAREAVPVDMITDAQFSQIMKGVKTAKEATGKPKVDRVADQEEQKPTPPTPDAKRDIPTPPSPEKRLPDPSEADDEKPPTPTPPTPPPRPVTPPPVAKAAPQEDKQEPDKADAEPIKPPPRPKKPEKKVETKPEPPKPPKKPEPKPPKLDEVAKLLNEAKDKPAHKRKSGEESHEHRPQPNLAEISQLLSHETAQSRGSSGRQLNRVASLGAPHASAARMSPSLSDALNGLLQEQYKQCWSYLALSNGPKYVAKVRVSYQPDGSLSGEPALINPPSDPEARSLAESALRAVRRCNPLKIPAKFQPYYDQWKDWVVGFDPEDLN